MVSEEEQELIRERMAQAGIRNMGAYMRRMALCGYVLQIVGNVPMSTGRWVE